MGRKLYVIVINASYTNINFSKNIKIIMHIDMLKHIKYYKEYNYLFINSYIRC